MCYWCTHKGYVCRQCYASEGLCHSHEEDYICEACGGGVPKFLTADEFTLRLANIEAFKAKLHKSS